MHKAGNYPIINDIHGKLLLDGRVDLTQINIKKIIRDNRFKKEPVISLEDTAIFSDIVSVMQTGIYNTIFSDKKNLRQIISVFKQSTLTNSLIMELTALKKIIPHTYFHILIVAALSTKISLDLHSEGHDPIKSANLGLVHDLGKSRLPVEVLEKRGPLTRQEFALIQTHPLIDYLLIMYYLQPRNTFIARASYSHHERLDGSGYPCGKHHLNHYIQALIPCDVFDALISHRPYRSAPYTIRAALDLLLEESMKGKINRKFVLLLISYVRKDKPHFKTVKISRLHRDLPPKVNYYGIHI